MRKTNKRTHLRRRRPARTDAWQQDLLPFAAGAAVGSLGLLLASRQLLGRTVRRWLRVLMTDPYDANLLELYSAISRYGLQNLGETELRATLGTVLQRPLGSPKRFPDLSGVMFNVAQLETMPTPLDVPIDLKVTIGPQATRPLQIDLPVMVSGMAYGWALSEDAKVALALGAAQAGTASNTGQGPWLESERKAAKKLIYQYHRGHWGKTERILRQSDGIEIQFGQGATAGLAVVLEAELMDQRLREQFEVQSGQPAIAQARQPEVQRPSDLVQLVRRLRHESGGVPVGVKLAAGQQLEQDLRHVLQAEVDFITLDGAEGATKGSPPITEDDFGLPTAYALARAARFLREQRAEGRVSLVISGGLRTPGDFLKAVALGATAVDIGSTALFAMSHKQSLHAIPFEPPTQAAWYGGRSAQLFNRQTGGESLGRFLRSCHDEMEEGIRALGKTRLQEVGRSDLVALDRQTADVFDLPLAYRAP